jgi:HYDIN/CFA65/VesB-like, Ig-like domain
MSHNRSVRYTNRPKQPEKAGPLLVAIAGFVLILMASLALIRPVSNVLNDLNGSGSPSLKVDQEKVDLGDVKLGQSVSVTFQLTNVGNKTLRFSQDPYIEIVKGC